MDVSYSLSRDVYQVHTMPDAWLDSEYILVSRDLAPCITELIKHQVLMSIMGSLVGEPVKMNVIMNIEVVFYEATFYCAI